MELKIEYLDKSQLKPYANNAKLHPAEQVEQIKKSIREFGFNDPIAIWRENEVIEGHGRLLAVMDMNEIDQVPVIRLDDLTDEQRRAYMLVHNKLTMNTGWNNNLLKLELEDIVELDMGEFGLPLTLTVKRRHWSFLTQKTKRKKTRMSLLAIARNADFILRCQNENLCICSIGICKANIQE